MTGPAPRTAAVPGRPPYPGAGQGGARAWVPNPHQPPLRPDVAKVEGCISPLTRTNPRCARTWPTLVPAPYGPTDPHHPLDI
jgi:hypothetical protein